MPTIAVRATSERFLGALTIGSLAIVLGGCATTPLLRCPAQGGASWTALDSPRLRLRTDAPAERVTSLFEALAAALTLVERVLSPVGPPAPHEALDLVVIDDRRRFEALAPPGAAGWFVPRSGSEARFEAPFADPPLVVLRGGDLASVLRRFQHELVHQLLPRRGATPSLPPWLEEGLAEYHSTLRWEALPGATRITVGELPMRTLFVSEPAANPGLGARLVEHRVALWEAPPLGELLGASEAAFHDPARELAFYSSAWVLVHLLATSPAWSPRLRALLADLAQGAPPERAFQQRFDGAARARLESEYRRHLEGDDRPGEQLLVEEVPPLPGRPIRTLGDEEVHLLWARVRPWTSRESIRAAGADIAVAQAEHPSAETHYWMARYLRTWRRFAEAEQELRIAITLGGDDPRFRTALAALARERPAAYRKVTPRGGGGSSRSAVLAE